jgi:hypothetical protein
MVLGGGRFEHRRVRIEENKEKRQQIEDCLFYFIQFVEHSSAAWMGSAGGKAVFRPPRGRRKQLQQSFLFPETFCT